MNVEQIDDDLYRLTVTGGKVRDKRTLRKYRVVVCSEANLKHFEAA